MSLRLPGLLADPPAPTGRLWLTNARLFDGTGGPVRTGAGVLVEDGRITLTGDATGGVPESATVIDLGGRTLMPGLIDAHTHLKADLPAPEQGSEPLWPDISAHFVMAALRKALRMGITTLRDVGSFGDHVVTARQAMRYGAFTGPRVLTCGRIVSATSPGGRFFNGMYREADGPDAMRMAVREQARRGADFVKFMSTGARSVELEDPEPAQLTEAEVTALIDEAHRLGYRVCAHAEGLAGTELAVRHGADTIEHGMHLYQRPDLLDAMASAGQVLVPTLSCYYGIAGYGDAVGAPSPDSARSGNWTGQLVSLAEQNLSEAEATLRAAKAAGVALAMGRDWHPIEDSGLEILRMIHHGLTAAEALAAATSGSARALGLSHEVGTVAAGRLADLIVVDGDPVADPALLRDPDRIWLVLRCGEQVAGTVLEGTPPSSP